MRNGKYQCTIAASFTYTCMLSPPSCSLRAIQKAYLDEKCWRIFWKSQENGPLAEKCQHKKTGLGRKMRGDRKQESNDSPEIPHRRDTSDIRYIPRLTSGGGWGWGGGRKGGEGLSNTDAKLTMIRKLSLCRVKGSTKVKKRLTFCVVKSSH